MSCEIASELIFMKWSKLLLHLNNINVVLCNTVAVRDACYSPIIFFFFLD